MPTIGRTFPAAAVVAFLALGACQRQGNEANSATNIANAEEQQAVPVTPIPVPAPPLDRGQLLLAAAHAASDFAAGIDDEPRQRALADKKFEFRIRFGCEGAPPGADPGWTFNESRPALKVRATPSLNTDDSSVKAIAQDRFETVEGFWIRRPWLLSQVCPRTSAREAQQTPLDPQIVGIAQFFTKSDSRTMRRSGRAYEVTKRLEEGDKPAGGFDLVLSGRLKAFPDGTVIACVDRPGSERPACVISVEFGKVTLERADTREQLARWGNG